MRGSARPRESPQKTVLKERNLKKEAFKRIREINENNKTTINKINGNLIPIAGVSGVNYHKNVISHL